jgi:hypothetical protein
VGRGLGGEGSIVIRVLDIDEVNLHATLSLDTNDQRRALASGDDLMRVVNGFDQQTVSSLKLLDDGLGQLSEADAGVGIEEVLRELSNAFRVSLGLELEALGGEQGLQLLVVGNDAIVNDGELPVRIRATQKRIESVSLL